MATILIVDDEPSVLFTMKEIVVELGHVAREAESGRAALAALDDEVDLVLTDLAMPEMDGLTLLTELRRTSEVPVVLLTARGSERIAARAMKAGAFDYLPKPFDVDELEATIGRALELTAWRREARRSATTALLGRPFVGRAPSFLRVIDRAMRFARRDAPVLIRGETGTGKELLAQLLHAGSARAHGPFVRFNCAAISEEVAESELFGHVRGAFTGAVSPHRGFFARAHGGTLVLDEVGELSPRLQPKLLRALQSGEIQAVGAPSVETVDVRVVSCTHRDLLRQGFREDLFYRIAVLDLEMPALRDRVEDVPLLAEVFARSAAERFGVEGTSLSSSLLATLSKRHYPGNIRELENLVTRLVALSEGGEIDGDDAHLDDTNASAREGSIDEETGSPELPFRAQVERFERALLSRALKEAAGNQSEAARRLGLSRATFLDKLKRYALPS